VEFTTLPGQPRSPLKTRTIPRKSRRVSPLTAFSQRFPTIPEVHCQLGGRTADLHAGDFHTTEFFRNRLNLAGGHSLDVHLGQCDHQGSLTSQAFLQSRWIKAAFSHLWHGKSDLAHPGPDCLWLVTISMPFPVFRTLVLTGVEILCPLCLHGLIDQDTQ